MKDIKKSLLELFDKGYCTPKILKIAKKIKEPSSTIHYNIKKLEEQGIIKDYKAVIDYKKIEKGYLNFVFVNLSSKRYTCPEELSLLLIKYEMIFEVHICTGDYELLLKIRTKDIDEYYLFIKKIIKLYDFSKISSFSSLKEF
jgi:DNA-binding Lrp family transcriptional regulator